MPSRIIVNPRAVDTQIIHDAGIFKILIRVDSPASAFTV